MSDTDQTALAGSRSTRSTDPSGPRSAPGWATGVSPCPASSATSSTSSPLAATPRELEIGRRAPYTLQTRPEWTTDVRPGLDPHGRGRRGRTDARTPCAATVVVDSAGHSFRPAVLPPRVVGAEGVADLEAPTSCSTVSRLLCRMPDAGVGVGVGRARACAHYVRVPAAPVGAPKFAARSVLFTRSVCSHELPRFRTSESLR